MLATRLKKVMDKLILIIQSSFIPNRKMLDEMLVIKELVDLEKRQNKEFMMIKVDFEKSNDYVS